MRVGLMLPMFGGDPTRTLHFAHRAEACGFDGVFAADHLFPPGRAESAALDPLAMLAAVAAGVPRLAIGTLVTRVGLRPLGTLAKEAAALASMADHFVLGLGAGDEGDAPERERFGVGPSGPAADRRAALAETAVALRAIFDGDAWEGGRHTPAVAGPLAPGPRERPPVWLGGSSDAVARLAGEHADGWNGWGMDPDTFAAKAAIVRSAARDRAATVAVTWADLVVTAPDERTLAAAVDERRATGKPPGWACTTRQLADRLRGLADAGASWAILAPATRSDLDPVAVAAEALSGVSRG